MDVTIYEGDARAHTEAIYATKSRTDATASRNIQMSNCGSHEVRWNATLFDEHGDQKMGDGVTSWVILNNDEGVLPPQTTTNKSANCRI